MTNMITAAAASAAAIFSLVNVLLSNRFARTTQVQQWRRDSVRKNISEFLDIARELGDANQRLFRKIEDLERPSELLVEDLLGMLYSEGIMGPDGARTRAQHLLSELQLVASIDCVRAGYQLFQSLSWDDFVEHLIIPDSTSREEIHADRVIEGETAREDFILVCRADLGVDHRRRRTQTNVRFRST